MAKDTLFTNDSGSAAGPVNYVQDSFNDVSLPASTNSGLTDNANTNPTGQFFANDDGVRYGIKTLYIKDISLLQDRSLWINNVLTYEVIFNESFPLIKAYVYGRIEINQITGVAQPILKFKTLASGIDVVGPIRRVSYLVAGDTSATATGQITVDGTNTTTIDWSGLASNSDAALATKYIPFAHASSNATKDLHDFRLTSIQADTFKLVGIQVYFENTGGNIDVSPGLTYVNKSAITTSAGASLALPSFGSSLGGRGYVYKTQTSGYSAAPFNYPVVTSIGQGSNGSALISVSSGHGASFKAGYGIAISNGSSNYVGSIQSISTDTLTVNPPLPFGVSNTIYRTWSAGSTIPIGATLYQLATTIDFSKYYGRGFTLPIYDPQGNWCAYNSGAGITQISAQIGSAFSTQGFFQVEGYFSAADMEIVGDPGTGWFKASVSVNGLTSWQANEGVSNIIKKTIFTDAGSGWNSFTVNPGSSMANLAVLKVNLYTHTRSTGVTFGVLSEFDQMQSYTDRGTVSSALTALGVFKRVYADQLYLKGGWTAGFSTGFIANMSYVGASTNSTFRLEYYGKNFCVIGTAGASSALTLDGVVMGATFNAMVPVATEGFHTVTYNQTGGSCLIQAIDFVRSRAEIVCTQNFELPYSRRKTIKVPIVTEWTRNEDFVPNSGGFGTVTNKVIFIKRNGDRLKCRGEFKAGTVSTGDASFILPAPYVIDKFKFSTRQTHRVGEYDQLTGGDVNIPTSTSGECAIYFDGSNTNQVFFSKQSASNVFTKAAGNSISNNSEVSTFEFEVPIVGWNETQDIEVSNYV